MYEIILSQNRWRSRISDRHLYCHYRFLTCYIRELNMNYKKHYILKINPSSKKWVNSNTRYNKYQKELLLGIIVSMLNKHSPKNFKSLDNFLKWYNKQPLYMKLSYADFNCWVHN